jgi:alpha-2-macroglobulin
VFRSCILSLTLFGLAACSSDAPDAAKTAVPGEVLDDGSTAIDPTIAPLIAPAAKIGDEIPITFATMAPSFSTGGSPQEIPAHFSIDLTDAFLKGNHRKADKGTEITITPAIASRNGWVHSQDRRSLIYVPDAPGFMPDTEYTITVGALVITGDKILKPEKSLIFTTKTPVFKALGAQIVRRIQGSRRHTDLAVRFTGPVTTEGAVERIKVTVDGVPRAIARVRQGRGIAESRRLIIELQYRSHYKGAQIEVALTDDWPTPLGASIKGAGTTTLLRMPSAKDLQIFAVTPVESGDGYNLEVICRDHTFNSRRYHYHRPSRRSFRISPRCALDEASARNSIQLIPERPFTVIAVRGGFRIRAPFTKGSTELVIKSGAKTVDGATLYGTHSYPLTIPARSKKLSFSSSGRYLPRRAFKRIALQHTNVTRATVVINQIRPDNLVHWLNQYNEEAGKSVADRVVEKTLALSGTPEKSNTSWLDLDSLLPAGRKGVYEIQVHSKGARARLRLLATDINLIAKMAADKSVRGYATHIETHQPLAGVQLKLVTPSGRALSTCTTDTSGSCNLAGRAKDSVDKHEAIALVATHEDDLTYIRFKDLLLSTAGADVSGRSFGGTQQDYTVALYTDRGVYRPGEVAHLSGIVRGADNTAPKAGLPIELSLIDPRRRTTKRVQRKLDAAGMFSLDFPFADFAQTGRYRVAAKIGDKGVGQINFHVEEFVPERMRVSVDPAREAPRKLSVAQAVKVDAQYLFGGSAKGSRTEVTCNLAASTFAPKGFEGFSFGRWRDRKERNISIPLGQVTGVLDKDGKGELLCPAPTSTKKLGSTGKITAVAAVFEAGSGRTTTARTTFEVHGSEVYIGLKTKDAKAAKGKPIAVTGALVGADGKLAALDRPIKLELLRIDQENDWAYDEERGRWRHTSITRKVVDATVELTAKGGRFSGSITPGQAAHRYLLRATSGDLQTGRTVRGSSYWWGSYESVSDRTPKPFKPESLTINLPSKATVGSPTTVEFQSPYTGRALITLESDRVFASHWMDVTPGAHKWSFTLTKFLPNLYVSILVLKNPGKAGTGSFVPARAFGVESVTVKPTEFDLGGKLSHPAEIQPNRELTVRFDLGKAAAGGSATIAAVDEGVLQLTRFKTPDPFAKLFARRGLGVSSYETIGWNILLPASGTSSEHGGGQEGGGKKPGRVQPVKPVALWSGLKKIPANGIVEVTFKVPTFRGALRVMAIAATQTKMAQAEGKVIVRDPLVLQTTLPRFLSQGDRFQIPVFVTNMSGKPQTVKVRVSASAIATPGALPSPLKGKPVLQFRGGKTERSLSLKADESGTAVFEVTALQAVGAAKLRVDASSGKLKSFDELLVPFRPAAPESRQVKRIELKNGTNGMKDHLAGWLPTTESSTFWVTTNPYGARFDHLKHILRYPYGCIEQTTSSTRPLLFADRLLGNVLPILANREEVGKRVQAGIDRIFSMQTGSGGFAYWPGGNEPNNWGTAYATHMLLDAKDAGWPVDGFGLSDALRYIERELNASDGGLVGLRNRYGYRRSLSAEVYMHYVAARAGKGRKARLRTLRNTLIKQPGSQMKELTYITTAALHLAGDHRHKAYLKTLDNSPIAADRTNRWDFYSDLRRRGLMLSLFTELFGDDAAGEGLATHVAAGLNRKSRYYNTQEIAWALTGLGKRIGKRPATTVGTIKLLANGKAVAPTVALKEGAKAIDPTWSLSRASEYDNVSLDVAGTSGGSLYLILASRGVSTDAKWAVGGTGLKVERILQKVDGTRFDPNKDRLTLGDLVTVRVRLTNNTGGTVQNIALVDRLPAGFEIENANLGRGRQLQGVDKNSIWNAAHRNQRDDRMEVFGEIGRRRTVEFAYSARAVSAGSFRHPPVSAEAMYDPAIWAREAGQEVVIQGPWDNLLD